VHAAAALSEHPLATHALGECVGQLMESGGTHPGLLVVTSTAAYQGALEDIVDAARRLLSPSVLVGSSAIGVLAGGREVEEHAGLAMFAWWGGSGGADSIDPVRLARPVRLERRDLTRGVPGPGELHPADAAPTAPPATGPASVLGGLAGAAGTLVLFADPFTCEPDDLLAALGECAPDVAVVGGFVGAARHRGGNRLLLDGQQFADGAVGVLLDPSVPVTTVVSHGTRSIGQPMTVTAAERRVVRELAGRSAFGRLRAAIEDCQPDDQLLAAQGVLLGRIHDDHRGASDSSRPYSRASGRSAPDSRASGRSAPGRGAPDSSDTGLEHDLTMTSVLGADHDVGALAIAEEIPVGATVQFHVRGSSPAHEDLLARLAAVAPEEPRGAGPDGALVFTSAARGAAFFGNPDHDAATVAEHLASGAVAGAFCSGELAPVGGRNTAHSSSAVVLLLG